MKLDLFSILKSIQYSIDDGDNSKQFISILLLMSIKKGAFNLFFLVFEVTMQGSFAFTHLTKNRYFRYNGISEVTGIKLIRLITFF